MSNKFPYVLAVKSLLGGYKEASDPKDSTHVILTTTEYNELIDDYNKKINYNKTLLNDLQQANSTNKIINDKLQSIKNKNYELEKQNKDLNDEVEKLSIECDHLNGQNAVLNKINKERSNKQIDPLGHKTRPGYYILRYQDSALRYKEESKEKKVIRGHKIVFLTPYSLSMDINDTKVLVEEDLTKAKNGNIPILRLIAGEHYFLQKNYVDVEANLLERKKKIAEDLISERKGKPYDELFDNNEKGRLVKSEGTNQYPEYQKRIANLNMKNAFYNLNLQFDKNYPNWCVELYCTHDINCFPESLLFSNKKKKNKEE